MHSFVITDDPRILVLLEARLPSELNCQISDGVCMITQKPWLNGRKPTNELVQSRIAVITKAIAAVPAAIKEAEQVLHNVV